MGKGVGSAILDLVLKKVAVAGLAKLKCFSSLPAKGFYARHGFMKIDQVNVMLGESIYFPAVLMQRNLAGWGLIDRQQTNPLPHYLAMKMQSRYYPTALGRLG